MKFVNILKTTRLCSECSDSLKVQIFPLLGCLVLSITRGNQSCRHFIGQISGGMLLSFAGQVSPQGHGSKHCSKVEKM